MNSFPRRIYFAITNDCNLKCIHCYRSSASPHANELSTQEILSFLGYCVASAEKGLLTVTLTGGEPLKRKDFWIILDYCLLNEINIDIATNSLLLTEPIVLKLRDYPNVNLQLSVDGASSNTVDPLRGRGTFNKIIKSLQLIQRFELYKYVDMNFVTILTRLNYMEIGHIVELAKSFSIFKVVFGECMPVGRASQHQDTVILSGSELEHAIKTLSAIRKANSDMVVVSQFYFDFLYDKEFARANVCTAECGDVACVGPSGDVTLCPAFSEDNSSFVGNIRSMPLVDILKSKKCADFKQRTRQLRTDCEHWSMCKGGCHIYSEKMLGSNQECDPRCPMIKH